MERDEVNVASGAVVRLRRGRLRPVRHIGHAVADVDRERYGTVVRAHSAGYERSDVGAC